MKITQIAVGAAEYTGHVLYALDDSGRLWRYTPTYVSPGGNTRRADWSHVEGPSDA